MIDNFVPQPFPLECSAEEGSWMLVIGWQRTGDGRLAPLVATADGPIQNPVPSNLRYRVADTRPAAAAPTMRPAAPRSARREHPA